jgi:uncharacterized protein (UPF0548 family)
MLLLGLPSQDKLQKIWDDAEGAVPSYREVGATAASELPAGYHHDRRETNLAGVDVFEKAVIVLKNWSMHAKAGLRVFPEGQVLEPDTTVLVLVPLGPATAVAPCRIVYTIDESERFGFAYGTLPGHPERGEEAFVVDRSDDGGARLTIRAFSRPDDRLARIGAPITRLIQKRATSAYVTAFMTLVSRP